VSTYSVVVSRHLLPRLRQFDSADRREIRRIIGLIQLDPSPDNRVKILIPVMPVFYTAYMTGRFWIVYHVNGRVIHIDNVGRAGLSEPTPW